MTGAMPVLAARGSSSGPSVNGDAGSFAGHQSVCGLLDGVAAFPESNPCAATSRDRAARLNVGVKPAPTRKALRLGTRDSALARWQAGHVAELLRKAGIKVQIIDISTLGDRIRDCPINELPSNAPFTDDIECALQAGEIDLAVHSLKDLPVRLRADLHIAAILPRGDVGESLVSYGDVRLADLPPGAVIGTSSPRRAAQLRAVRPDLRTAPIRGPVDERVRQVRTRKFDATILATVGLRRLGLMREIGERLPLDVFLPAPGQGAMAVQIRADDAPLNAVCAEFDHEPTRRATTAELEFLQMFEFDENIAVAAYAVAADRITLKARLLALDGPVVKDATVVGDDSTEVAAKAAEELRYPPPAFVEAM